MEDNCPDTDHWCCFAYKLLHDELVWVADAEGDMLPAQMVAESILELLMK